MSPAAAQPPPRSAGYRGSGSGRRQPFPRRPVHDPYRPEYSVILAVSPDMRARYPRLTAIPRRSPPARRQAATPQRAVADNPANPTAKQPQPARPGGQAFWTELPCTAASPGRARAAVRCILAS